MRVYRRMRENVAAIRKPAIRISDGYCCTAWACNRESWSLGRLFGPCGSRVFSMMRASTRDRSNTHITKIEFCRTTGQLHRHNASRNAIRTWEAEAHTSATSTNDGDYISRIDYTPDCLSCHVPSFRPRNEAAFVTLSILVTHLCLSIFITSVIPCREYY